MKSIIALEELIAENEMRVKLQTRQIADHESGECRLSRLALSSAETNLENATMLLEKYRGMLEKLLSVDREELDEKERIQEAIQRKKYFENQYIRIKNNRERPSDQKLEAMLILDELASEVQFEDDEIFEIALSSLELNLTIHQELRDKLDVIRKDFDALLRGARHEQIHDLALLNYQIPILVLHFSVLLENVKEVVEEGMHEENSDESDSSNAKTSEETNSENEVSEEITVVTENKEISLEKTNEANEPNKKLKKENPFPGFPKYEDWWIHELWKSHQAYFALYKWKAIVSSLCITSKQKRAWNIIFDNWIFMKKMINGKSKLAFEYALAFDTLLIKHAEFEEELSVKKLITMEAIIKTITKKENFSSYSKKHNIITPYMTFKRKRFEQLEK